MIAATDWIILARFYPKDSDRIQVETTDEAKFMESSASMYRVISAGAVFGAEGWDRPYSTGDIVLASTIGGVRVRTKEGETMFAIRMGYVICKLEEGDI